MRRNRPQKSTSQERPKVEIVETEIVFEQRYVVGAVLADVDARSRTGHLLHLRKFPAGGNPELSVGLQHTKTRTAQRQILRASGFDEAIQNRIIEDRPPLEIFGRLMGDAGLLGLHPVIRDRSLGCFKIGAEIDTGGHERERQQP